MQISIRKEVISFFFIFYFLLISITFFIFSFIFNFFGLYHLMPNVNNVAADLENDKKIVSGRHNCSSHFLFSKHVFS